MTKMNQNSMNHLCSLITQLSRPDVAVETVLEAFERVEIHNQVIELTLWRAGQHAGRMHEFVKLRSAQHYPPHIHEHSSAHLQIIFGTGVLILDGERIPYCAGDRFPVPSGTSHGFDVDETTLLLSSQWPPIMSDDQTTIDIRPA